MTPRHISAAFQGCTNRFVHPSISRLRSRTGQAMVESLIVLLVLVAGFLFFFDFSYGVVARLLLHNGVSRVARADTVGFNPFHQTKCYRVSMIPVSGRRTSSANTSSLQDPWVELAFVKAYLSSETASEARGILDYERWETLDHHVSRKNDLIHVSGNFSIPTQMPAKLASFSGVAKNSDELTVSAEWSIEDHASYYLSR